MEDGCSQLTLPPAFQKPDFERKSMLRSVLATPAGPSG
jgi:hypothetical protein